MPELSRLQIFVYGSLAVGALFVGARLVGSASGAGPAPDGSVRSSEPGGGLRVEAGGDDVVVHVAGAVNDPGVYRLPSGSRVQDAIQRAGGASRGAALDSINLAAPLGDGQQVQVPGRGAAVAGGDAQGPVSLGSATAEDLDAIEGIGPVTAAAILEFRDEQGGISSIDELDQVSGIGPATLEALEGSLTP